MRSIDDKNHGISGIKSVGNKGFPGVRTVWITVLAPGFFLLYKGVGTGLLGRKTEGPVYRLDNRQVVEIGLLKWGLS